MKAATYDECYRDIVAIWRDEGGKSLDDIAQRGLERIVSLFEVNG